MIYVLVPFSALFVLYLRQENRYRFRPATILKVGLTSLLSLCLLLGLIGDFTPPGLLFFCGMCCAAAGDYYLQFIQRDNGKFVRGICAFGVTQLFYLTALHLLVPFTQAELFCLLGFAAATAFVKLHFRWDTSAADPWLTLYTALVTLTGAKAASLLFVVPASPELLLLGMGGILFYLSDMVLGLWNYQKTHILLADLNWLLYFYGQFLLAAGILFDRL